MTAANSTTIEQIRIDGGLAGLEALNKMEKAIDKALEVEAEADVSDSQYWRAWDDTLSYVRVAAGYMPPRAEGVLMAMAEYIYNAMLDPGNSLVCTDGRWKPQAAMTSEEVTADREHYNQFRNGLDVKVANHG